ncbi:MAG: insulinase family protein [Gammaproteobacteria bacterium]
MSTVLQESPTPEPPARAHPAFEWRRSQRIDALNLVVEEYRHRKTGALHYHLAADNTENVFLVALRTVPTDSTGVAHILEHTALCGSERYPVRDPFFMMIRRSLNTFMNAFTSSDWTAYPFASQNRKDFDNLLDVYLDAVFFSRLDPLDFAQEGHRVEFAEAGNPDSDLVFKGVVFNEMKGAMSSPVSTLWQTLTKYLFPTTTYHFNSGGEPEDIPDLSYEALRDFYRTHYHPSNAVFMTYGDIPAHEHQARFEERALARFEPLDVHIAVAEEKRYYAPVCVEEAYALDDDQRVEDKTHLVMGWLLGNSTDLEEQMKGQLLEGVLLDDSASPLRQALERTELGSAPSPLCGLESSNFEMSFMCGLEGSRPEHAPAFEQMVLEVLEQVARDGVPLERVEAVLHQLELSQREVAGDGYPYGLQLILEGLSAAIHRGDPVAAMDLDPVLARLRVAIQDPRFIPDLVRAWLLDNPHRVRLTLRPEPRISARRQAAEAARLATRKAAMDEAERIRVIEQAAALAARQQQEDDPGMLPKVGLEDIPLALPIAQGEALELAGRPAHFYAQGTNGLAYQQAVIDLPGLAPELLELLPQYTSCLVELGCGERDYLSMQAWQSSVSGGISATTSVRAAIDDEQATQGILVLSSKALVRNHAAMSELMRVTLEEVRFDEHERIRDLVAQQRARREQSVTGNGHGLAMQAAASGMSPTASLLHRQRGLTGIHRIKALDDGLEQGDALQRLAGQLQQIHQAVLAAPRQFLLIGEEEQREQLQRELEQQWQVVVASGSGYQPLDLPPLRDRVRQAWLTSTQVNFCAKAYPTVPADHPDAPVLAVLAGVLRNGFLHRAVREQGGAYGGGASHDTDAAALRFYSYRDPRLAETLADFDRSIDWLLGETLSWRLVEEAILGVIGSIDKPGSPAGEARDAFFNNLFGRTPEQRKRYRQRVLEVRAEDIRRVGETYLLPERASVAVITNGGQLELCKGLGLEIHNL